MSQSVTFNNVSYTIPSTGDVSWGTNVSNYLVAIAAGTLQPVGGSFPLTADVNFGSNFGLASLYYKSTSSNVASAGQVRLASTDTLKWRNNANSGDVALSKDTSDNLLWNGTKTVLSGAIVNADIASGAAIAYSKLALTGSILNADLAGSIAVNKLAALSTSKAVATDGSGFLVAATTTAAELNFVSGVTSAIQTQIGTKAAIAGQQFTGNISFDVASHGIVGVTGGGSAATGNVGEVISSTVTGASAPASGANGDLTSIPLTAGNWLVSCFATVNMGSATGVANDDFDVGISTTSGNSSAGMTSGDNQGFASVTTAGNVIIPLATVTIPNYKVTPSGSTTYFLKVRIGAYSTATPTISGRITAVRIS